MVKLRTGITSIMAFSASLLEDGPRNLDNGIENHIAEFTSPSTFCSDNGVNKATYQDVMVSMINKKLPIPVVFRHEPTIMAYLIQVEKEDTACENRKYKKGKRKTKEGKCTSSTLTFNFSFQNAVYPHPTSLTTDMLNEYLKSLGTSRNKSKIGKLLKFEVAVTGDTPTSRGFRDLNIYVKAAKTFPFVPFDSIFTQEVCNFQKIPTGFISYASSLCDKRITDIFVSDEPVYMGTKVRYRRGIDKKTARHQRQVQTALALLSFPRRERLSLFFNAAPISRFYRKAVDDNVVEPINTCIQQVMGLMGEKEEHWIIHDSYKDFKNWTIEKDNGIREGLMKIRTDKLVTNKKRKTDLFKVTVNNDKVSISLK